MFRADYVQFAKINTEYQFEIEMTLFIFSVLYIEQCERNFQCEVKNRGENDWVRLKRNQNKKFFSMYSNIIDLQQTITLGK